MEGHEVILVAVDASKEITDYALQWAVQNVIKSTDSLILLAFLPPPTCPPLPPAPNRTVYKFLSRLVKKMSNGQDSFDKNGFVDDGSDMPQRIYNVCAWMIKQLFKLHNVVKVVTQVKVVAYAPVGSIAMAAAELGATWVILDRRLKKESDCCLKQLNCNIILIDHAIPKILRSSVKFPTSKKSNKMRSLSDPTVADMLGVVPTYSIPPDNHKSPTSTQSSLRSYTTKTDTTMYTSSSSSSTNKDYFLSTSPPPVIKLKPVDTSPRLSTYAFQPEGDTKVIYRPTTNSSKSQPLNKVLKFEDEAPRKSTAIRTGDRTKSGSVLLKTRTDINKNNSAKTAPFPPRRSVDSRHTERPRIPNKSEDPFPRTLDRTSSIRRAMSISIKKPQAPPPLCSVCKHNAPVFGRAPRKFSYSEIETATDGFSTDNFLAKGGYGKVYRGVLADGQVIAVKQHVMLNAQGASEFCCGVEVLSCAQHRNLVMLVGYCFEIEWLLVYEFACNGSLDKHLYGTEKTEVMAWDNRMRVAIGSARGLRYLHEDCRVGCIVHRDFRPNNILLTHDYEPMVGDFGLARWQVDGQSGEDTSVIGAFGYLAPEYTQTGLITEKADVYAFGVVLLELLTGIKASEFSRKSGQQHNRRLFGVTVSVLFLAGRECTEIIDPQLENKYVVKEVEWMMHAASLCISPHPDQRPRMSKILKILEGDMPSDTAGRSTSVHPRQNLNGDRTDSIRNHKVNSGPPLMQPFHQMKLSPPSIQSVNRKENQWNSGFKQTMPLGDPKMATHYWDLNQTELVNDDYQEYLQGSLARYTQNLNVRKS
ncbi:hypothetical protein LguiA_016552 [Lonicera macranthoides]